MSLLGALQAGKVSGASFLHLRDRQALDAPPGRNLFWDQGDPKPWPNDFSVFYKLRDDSIDHMYRNGESNSGEGSTGTDNLTARQLRCGSATRHDTSRQPP